MIKENQKYLNRVQVILDIVTILLSFILSWVIRFKSPFYSTVGGTLTFSQYLIPMVLMTPIFIICFSIFKLYLPFRFKSYLEEAINVIKSIMLSLLIFVVILFLFKDIHYSRTFLLMFTVVSTVLVIIERAILRRILRGVRLKGYNKKHIIVVGYSDLCVEFLDRISKNKHWGYNVVGIVDDSMSLNRKNDEIAITVDNIEILGKTRDLEEILTSYLVDEVFITLNIKEYEKLSYIITATEKLGIRTQIIPDYFKYIPAKPYIEELDGLPVINIRYVPLDNLINKIVKRAFDIIGSLILILLAGPVMIAEAIIIKITSPGPVIFHQERVGLNNKTFTMYKFRSMNVQKENDEKLQWTTQNDPRKTKFGSFIRKTSLDELPQFFNVLFGDMSLVGPRPERPFFVEQFKEEIPKYMVKHQIRPGITGWAQVSGWRGDTSIVKRIECDIYYLENWNLWFDFKILFLTAFKGFVNKNAY